MAATFHQIQAERYKYVVQHKWVVAAILLAFLLVAWHQSVVTVARAHNQKENIAFKRMSEDDQTAALARLVAIPTSIRERVKLAIESNVEMITPHEAADLEKAGLAELERQTRLLVAVPDEKAVLKIHDESIGAVDHALQVLTVSRNGSGIIQDDVLTLTRGHGVSSRHPVEAKF